MQQEPLLFNETIRQNILFGNPRAQDQDVRKVATQANAMGFIMQNDEDTTSVQVQQRIQQEYADAVGTHIADAARLVNFSQIPTMVTGKRISFKELALITDLIPNLSEEGFRRIDGDIHEFLEAVTAKVQQADVTWNAVLRGFLFTPERRKIEQFLREFEELISVQRAREIQMALQMNEC